jgi:hypothetical protein
MAAPGAVLEEIVETPLEAGPGLNAQPARSGRSRKPAYRRTDRLLFVSDGIENERADNFHNTPILLPEI